MGVVLPTFLYWGGLDKVPGARRPQQQPCCPEIPEAGIPEPCVWGAGPSTVVGSPQLEVRSPVFTFAGCLPGVSAPGSPFNKDASMIALAPASPGGPPHN